MYWTILRFEIGYHLRRPSTYLFFVMTLLLGFFSIASEQFLSTTGPVARNSPAQLALIMTILTAIAQVITTALVGTAILRDVQLKSHELLFTTRVTRLGYLGGRLTGSTIVMILIYLGIPLGALLGTAMPWIDPTKLQAFRAASYIQPTLVLMIPNVVFISALFFAVGALTRNQLAIYVQGVLLLIFWEWTSRLLTDLDRRTLAGLMDPFAVTTLELATRYWSVAERNSRLIPVTGTLLWNRVLWLGVAAILTAITFAVVRLEAEPRRFGFGRRRRAVADAPDAAASATPRAETLAAPAVTLDFSPAMRIRQTLGEGWFTFRMIVRENTFRAIVLIGFINVMRGGWYFTRQRGSVLWPVTSLMLQATRDGIFLFVLILTTIYAGDLVWRERSLRADGIVDALPVPTSVTLIGKMLGFAGAMTLVMMVSIFGGVVMQTVQGYYHYEPGLYLSTMFGVVFPNVIQLTLLAFLVHALVNNKYIGHAIMIGFFVLNQVAQSWGLESVMYQYGFLPDYIYSDMNRYGHYAPFLQWVLGYYTALALALGVVAYLFLVRGADETWGLRWRTARARSRDVRTRLVGVGAAVLAVAMGGFVFYNTAVENEYVNAKALDQRRAAYERDYRRFRGMDAPKVVGVRVRADLVPEARHVALQSVYRLVNKSGRPLDTLLASVSTVLGAQSPTGEFRPGKLYHVDSLVWNRPTTVLVADTARGVYFYRLATPLAPGDSMTLAFGGHFTPEGFPNARPNNDIVANGTFLNSSYFPSLHYDEGVEIADDDKRREQHLAPRPRARLIDDPVGLRTNALSPDADWIQFDAEVSTAPDQIAIAPGYLQGERTENGRRVFTYHMDVPMLDFYSIQSGRYDVRRDQYKGVAIEIYYHPGHEFDLDRMIDATKRGLDYYSASFSPYQFRQYRIIEFPQYANFAQSFANTVPFSEGIGFIHRVQDPDALDLPLFVTAHELAHQWWGHQVVPADVQGASMLVESLAEYSALTVMERRYGASHAQKFLRYELDAYLNGRRNERKKEMPLMLVENQQYIHYNKGSLVFYALRDYIGEDSLNAALRRFVHDKAFASSRYPTTKDFLPYIRAVTPDSLQYVIHDLFETITLYDNKAVTATAKQRADKQYDVHLTFDAKKFRSDSVGNMTEIPVADYIDVGVFGAAEPGNKLGKPLAVRKVHVTQGETAIDFVVPERPLKAGIDPYNKLIDRTPEDNVMAVTITQ
jgi:ABC-2 type transport system permease protein